jgi:hypothetical protein
MPRSRRSRILPSALSVALFGLAGTAAPCTATEPAPVSFRNDVLPILGRAGCNAGACHAKQGGQNGFQLTIFSYDPAADHREIVFNANGRRVFPAAPEQSLLLLKATQAIEHEGGKKIEPGSDAYRTLVTWIRQGVPDRIPGEPALDRISVDPPAGTYAKGSTRQLRVTAHYTDGSTRDVTRLSEYNAPDKATVDADHDGRVRVGATSGAGVIIVRYMDRVEVARINIPPDRVLPASAYADLPVHNEIDRLTWKRHQDLGLLASAPCTDGEFIRRASLDAVGKLPSPERVRSFLGDTAADKRARYVDELLADPDWADHWATKWRDLIVPNPQRVGVKPVYLLDRWIRRQLREDSRWDRFVHGLLTATGSTHEHGPAAVFRDQREPEMLSAYVSRLFLGVRLDCAKCHHHPSEKWSQDDYFQMAAFFGGVKRKGQGISAPISGEPEFIWWEPGGTVKHPVTEAVMVPKPPDGPVLDIPPDTDPREVLLGWMLAPENPYFSKAAVNRIWGEFFGRGIVHPVDDFRASNPAADDALLDWLARDFAAHGFDLKRPMRLILTSRVYQSSSLPNETNAGDVSHFSRAQRRRLPAEVFQDAVTSLTGVPDDLEGLPPEARAVLAWNNKLRSNFLDTFGRPNSSEECPCERDPSPTMAQTLHLMNSSQLQGQLQSSAGEAARWAGSDLPPDALAEELYLRAFSRFPDPEERALAASHLGPPGPDRLSRTQDLVWALLNSAEFVFNH